MPQPVIEEPSIEPLVQPVNIEDASYVTSNGGSRSSQK